jgi:hypothetical protein
MGLLYLYLYLNACQWYVELKHAALDGKCQSVVFGCIQCSKNQSSSRDTNPGQSLDLPVTFQDGRRRGRDGTISIGVFNSGASIVDGLTTERRRSKGNRNTGSIINRPPGSGGTTPVPERYVFHKILGVQTHHSS